MMLPARSIAFFAVALFASPVPSSALEPVKHEQGRLSWALHRVAWGYEQGRPLVAQGRRFVDGEAERVTAVIVLTPGANSEDVAGAVAAAGGSIEAEARQLGWVKVSLPTGALRSLSRHPAVSRMRVPYYASRKAVSSEGVAAIHADAYRARTGADGTGVTVAVLDLGFEGAQDLLGGELPADTELTDFVADRITSFDEPHGTACAEIVHDVAPGAHLVLAGFEDGVTWVEAINDLILRRVQVISHSIGFDNLFPPDGSSPLSEAVDLVAGQGILFVTSAGNEADKFYQGPAVDSDGNGMVEFGGTTELLPIGVPAEDARVVLRWDDPYDASEHDYDLFIVTEDFAANPVFEDNPAIIASSQDVQSGEGDPLEIVEPEVEEDQVLFAVVRHDPATPTRSDQRLYLWSHGGVAPEFATASGTLSLPADARGAVTVGAVAFDSLAVEGFSSRGPTADGRVKPDLAGPDRVATAAYSGEPFAGTSAAAPHVAGAAALLASADPSLSGPTLRQALEKSTRSGGNPAAKNNDVGFGVVDMDLAPSAGTPGPTPGREVVGETTFSGLEPFDPDARNAWGVRMTLSEPGNLEATVDWTTPANNLDIFLYRGSCDSFPSDECPQVASSTTRMKPEVLLLRGAAAQSYTLVIMNFGTTTESGTVVLAFVP